MIAKEELCFKLPFKICLFSNIFYNTLWIDCILKGNMEVKYYPCGYIQAACRKKEKKKKSINSVFSKTQELRGFIIQTLLKSLPFCYAIYLHLLT